MIGRRVDSLAVQVELETAEPPAVAAEDVRVRRGGIEALRGVSFTLGTGRVVGLLGPSGCGKTTLMRALVGVQARVSGRLGVLGKPPGVPALRRQVGYMTQAPSVYADLTVRQNLTYLAAVRGVPHAELDGLLAKVDLGAEAHRRVDALSGGQRARVSLACALLGEPRLLVLDEPTVGLDPVLRKRLWNLFGELAAGGVTLIVSSHVMDEARHCDELLLMREGRVLAHDTPSALAARAGSHDLEDAFLALIESSSMPGASSVEDESPRDAGAC
jgi:ABC-2 type transport system ATP-binding protein